MFSENQRTWARNAENTGIGVGRFARFRGVSMVGRLQNVCTPDGRLLRAVVEPFPELFATGWLRFAAALGVCLDLGEMCVVCCCFVALH